ncbi:MAG: hypothetical protein ACAH35_03060 [Candidatus Paceibacterota bacterium]
MVLKVFSFVGNAFLFIAVVAGTVVGLGLVTLAIFLGWSMLTSR